MLCDQARKAQNAKHSDKCNGEAIIAPIHNKAVWI